MDSVPYRTPEQAEKTAQRHNRKVAKRYPLFAHAGVIPDDFLWNTEIVLANERLFREGLEQFERKTIALVELL